MITNIRKIAFARKRKAIKKSATQISPQPNRSQKEILNQFSSAIRIFIKLLITGNPIKCDSLARFR